MRNYLTKLFFQIQKPDASTIQLDVQWHIVAAASKEEAFLQAQHLGEKQSNEIDDSWSFLGVCALHTLDLQADTFINSETIEVGDDPYWRCRIEALKKSVVEEIELKSNLPVF